MDVLVETIYSNGSMRITLPGTNCTASGSVTPLSMNLLDSLTVHARMSPCPTCSCPMPGASVTLCWRSSATICPTSSPTTASSCSATCTRWPQCPRPTRTSFTFGK
uniref:Uncharacterized protein n=1 Tax=Hucho hucho TaxID=62062 RepID=A0A4W5JRC6_9TELE